MEAGASQRQGSQAGAWEPAEKAGAEEPPKFLTTVLKRVSPFTPMSSRKLDNRSQNDYKRVK